MERAVYTVVPYESAWGIASGTEIAGPYVSKEAVFEAALGPAMSAVKLASTSGSWCRGTTIRDRPWVPLELAVPDSRLPAEQHDGRQECNETQDDWPKFCRISWRELQPWARLKA
jgi:hypothetical protein